MPELTEDNLELYPQDDLLKAWSSQPDRCYAVYLRYAANALLMEDGHERARRLRFIEPVLSVCARRVKRQVTKEKSDIRSFIKLMESKTVH